MRLIFHIWRQKDSASDHGQNGRATKPADLNPDMSMLEALDVLNEELIQSGEEPVAFEHDCREGICGSCGFMINGIAHGPLPQDHRLPAHAAAFQGWRGAVSGAVARPRVSGAQGSDGGPQRVRPHHRRGRIYFGVAPAARRTATPFRCRRKMPTAPWTRRPASAAEPAWRRAPTHRRRCSPARKSPIWACSRRASPNATHARLRMVAQMNREGFGHCTNIGECEAVCPKGIRLEVIAG